MNYQNCIGVLYLGVLVGMLVGAALVLHPFPWYIKIIMVSFATAAAVWGLFLEREVK